MADVGAVMTPPKNSKIIKDETNETHREPLIGNMWVLESYFEGIKLNKRRPSDGEGGDMGAL